MAKLSAEMKVGTMTVIAVLILVVLTFLVGKFVWFGKTYNLQVYFDFVGGIERGAPVRLGGVKVGIVKDIKIVPNYKPPIEVTLRLSDKAIVHSDARIYISTMGLMGEKYVEIYSGSPGKAVMANGSALNGQNPFQMEDILASSKQISEDLAKTMRVISQVVSKEETKNAIGNFISHIDGISARLDNILQKKQGDLETFVTNLKVVTDQMKVVVADVDTIVKENRVEIKSTVDKFSATAESLHTNITRIVDSLNKTAEQVNSAVTENQPELKSTMQNFRAASEDFKKAMEKLDTVTEKIQTGQGTIGKLVNDPSLYNETEKTVGSVRQAADAVKDIAGKTGGFINNITFEYDLRYYTVLDRFRNDIDLRFMPSKGSYYLAGVSDIGRDPEIDVLFAKAFGPIDAKLGVLESQAAAGIDYRLLDDRLKFGVKSVGLTQSQPRLDFDSEYHIVSYWYVVLGAHDLTHKVQSNAGVKIKY